MNSSTSFDVVARAVEKIRGRRRKGRTGPAVITFLVVDKPKKRSHYRNKDTGTLLRSPDPEEILPNSLPLDNPCHS